MSDPAEVEIRQLPAQPVVGTRERAGASRLRTVIAAALDEVRGYLRELGVRPAGPPLAIVGTVEVTAAWPVAEEVQGRGPIQSWTLPAARVLRMRHQGPYERLSDSYRLLERVMARNGLEPSDAPCELYLTGPDDVEDPAGYVTEIAWPIRPEGELDSDAVVTPPGEPVS